MSYSYDLRADFHGGNTGSNPVGDANKSILPNQISTACYWCFRDHRLDPWNNEQCGEVVSGIARRNSKGCDIGYALASSSCEGANQRGGMYRHSP